VRPNSVRYDPVKHVDEAFRFANLGLSKEAISELIGIDDRTFGKWMKSHPEFAAAIHSARNAADARVINSLYRKAADLDKKVTTKTLYGPTGKLIQKTVIESSYDTDGTMAKWWLSHRRAEDWAGTTLDASEDLPDADLINRIGYLAREHQKSDRSEPGRSSEDITEPD
jgi:hypothetical protein